MALFGGGAKKDAIENEILQAMADLEILNDLVATIAEKAEGSQTEEASDPWLTNCQGYYDNCIRTVTVAADLFEIRWSDVHYEKDGQGRNN